MTDSTSKAVIQNFTSIAEQELWRAAPQAYFPITILLADTKEQMSIAAPADIPLGRSYTVLEHQDFDDV